MDVWNNYCLLVIYFHFSAFIHFSQIFLSSVPWQGNFGSRFFRFFLFSHNRPIILILNLMGLSPPFLNLGVQLPRKYSSFILKKILLLTRIRCASLSCFISSLRQSKNKNAAV